MGTTIFLQDKQLERWNQLRDAYGYGEHGKGTKWIDYVMEHMANLYKWTSSEKPGGYVEAFQRVEAMRRDFWGEGY